MESNVIDILTLLLEEYRAQRKTESEELLKIEAVLLNIEELISKNVKETQKLNQRIGQIQDDIIELKYS